ncbi:hypothetical protein FisN_26Hh009 [Fistulifera solaris]|uniref:Uncharacterized protein n=1 Tax=Fistulifera solaris TaxID=1519565 RepID=A0A1Z5JXT0_FISSO|nr:hypothetical protein FisN_26Hh009 [Fistulifera solaris]|eukprot:GAX18719.1 hypothetical protein FisN_26Hh009 [Fistulifera solaris]
MSVSFPEDTNGSSLLQIVRENEEKEIDIIKHYVHYKNEKRRLRNLRGDCYHPSLVEQEKQLRAVIERNTSITDLFVNVGEERYTAEYFAGLARFLRPLMKLRNLRMVDISFRHVPFSTFQIILKERPNLEELILHCWDNIEPFLENQRSFLRLLPSTTAFSSLKKISFCNTHDYFHETADRKQDLGLLLEIPRMPQLQSMELTNMQITSLDMLTNFVANSTTLLSLTLNKVHLVTEYDDSPLNDQLDQWDILLVDALKSNSSLTSIRLQEINVSETVLCRTVTEALRQHPSVESVTQVFTEKKYSKDIFGSWLQVLQQNRNITDLTLTNWCPGSSASIYLIECHVRLNQIYKNLEGSCQQPMAGSHDVRVEAMIQANGDLACLHLLLLRDPTVVRLGLGVSRPATTSPIYRNSDFRSIQRKRKRRRLVPYREIIGIDSTCP